MFGPIAITYNVAGRRRLVLDGPTAAKIFNGTITTWNAPEIKALNAGATLPADPINVLFRSDESGTTDNFQKYLDAASDGAWGKGAGKTFNGGVGEGAKGNEGTSAAIKSTAGVDHLQRMVLREEPGPVDRQDRHLGRPGSGGADLPRSAGKSIDAVKIKGEGNDLVLDTSSVLQADRGRLVPDHARDLRNRLLEVLRTPTVATAVKAFLTVATTDGQKGLEDNGYIPLPDTFKARLSTAIDAIS